MLNKLLKEIIVITAGKPAEGIADLLETKNHINEFNIAKKMDITINQTRNILYKVSDHGLVSSIRKKDKKKGWYTYFWKFEIIKCLEFLKGILIEKMDGLNKELEERQQKLFYICKLCNIEVNEEKALLMNFTCNECGDIFTTKDNSKLIKELKRNVDKVHEKLKEVQIEIEKEMIVLEKIRQKEFKKQEKEKQLKKEEAALKRKEKRDAKKKEQEKADKKAGIKPVKKKIAKKKIAKKKVVTPKGIPPKSKAGSKKIIVKKKVVIKKKVVVKKKK